MSSPVQYHASLAHSMELAIGRIRELERRIDELSLENRRLAQLAHRDELTGLGNRRAFNARLRQALAHIDRHGGAISVLIADLDGLKRINDTLGHPAGDRALSRVGTVIAECVRAADFAARLGGDEFAVGMPSAGASDAQRLAERIRLRIANIELVGLPVLTASIGVATFAKTDERSRTPEDLIASADAALYVAKRGGRNTVRADAASRRVA